MITLSVFDDAVHDRQEAVLQLPATQYICWEFFGRRSSQKLRGLKQGH